MPKILCQDIGCRIVAVWFQHYRFFKNPWTNKLAMSYTRRLLEKMIFLRIKI